MRLVNSRCCKFLARKSIRTFFRLLIYFVLCVCLNKQDYGLDACHNLVQSTGNKRSSFVLRNDTAALIALSKSQQHGNPPERVSLVNNEAVIVFTERTAL